MAAPSFQDVAERVKTAVRPTRKATSVVPGLSKGLLEGFILEARKYDFEGLLTDIELGGTIPATVQQLKDAGVKPEFVEEIVRRRQVKGQSSPRKSQPRMAAIEVASDDEEGEPSASISAHSDMNAHLLLINTHLLDQLQQKLHQANRNISALVQRVEQLSAEQDEPIAVEDWLVDLSGKPKNKSKAKPKAQRRKKKHGQ